MHRRIPGIACPRCSQPWVRLSQGARCENCDVCIPEIEGVLDLDAQPPAGFPVDLEGPSMHDLLVEEAGALKGSELRRLLHEITGRMLGSLALLAPCNRAPFALVYPAGYGAIALRLAQLRGIAVLAFDRDRRRLRFLARRARLMGLEQVHPFRIGRLPPPLAQGGCELALILPGIQTNDSKWLAQCLSPTAEGLVVARGALWTLRSPAALVEARESRRVLRCFPGRARRRFRVGPDPVQVQWIEHPGGRAAARDPSAGRRGLVPTLPGGAPYVVTVHGRPGLLECSVREVLAGEDGMRKKLPPALVSATGMLIQLLGDQGSGRVLRMPFGLEARIRAERNHAMMRTIENLDLPEAIRSKVPRAGRQGEVMGCAFFIEQRMFGEPGSHLLHHARDRILREGAEFISHLHRCTTRSHSLSREFFARRVVGPLAALRRAFPAHAKAFQRLEREMEEKLIDRRIQFVLAHGDFKPDNCFFDPIDNRLLGVIDWDQSEDPGLPLLDLIHFIQASRRIADHRSYGQVVESGLGGEPLFGELIERYRQVVPFEESWLELLFVFDAIDHLSQHVPGPNELDLEWIQSNVAPVARRILEHWKGP